MMLKGIDVSHHNGEISWSQVDGDVKFVFVKATEGTDWADDHFHKNVSGAKSAGKKVGAYHFARFNDVGKAKAEALHFLSIVGSYDLDFHILDIEVGSGDLTEASKAFFDVLKEHNRKGLILYTYSSFLKNHFSHSLPVKLWIAHYGVKSPDFYYWKDWDIWQYTSKGQIKGIADNTLDLNVAKDNLWEEPKVEGSFKDVPVGFWAEPEISYLKSKGIVHGHPDGTVGVNENVTTDRLLVFIYNLIKYLEGNK